ncbi:MAG: hypothetical protein LBF57_01330 [Holosporaceae bacterium]|jgi:hypothetical protein|nr:hypothetical protein [Holosporaceae bacterium]
MRRQILIFLIGFFSFFRSYSIPIETPEFDERNPFVINSPEGWGYRTFKGKNGLIGVLWPNNLTFNATNIAAFVFLQNTNTKLPRKPANINLFYEKCPQAKFQFSSIEKINDETLSIAERYFTGRCGRTMILLQETVENYNVIIALVSAKYITKEQLADIKSVAASYKREIEKYIRQTSNSDKE